MGAKADIADTDAVRLQTTQLQASASSALLLQ
jgi:hypothetical protein